jgi:hypothetical protein
MRYCERDNAKETNTLKAEQDASKLGITLVNSPPYSHQSNGEAENRMRLNEDVTLTMLAHAGKDLRFWGYAAEAAAYTSQFVPYAQQRFKDEKRNTPYELFFEEDLPNLGHLRTWACDVVIHVPIEKRKKYETTGEAWHVLGIC